MAQVRKQGEKNEAEVEFFMFAVWKGFPGTVAGHLCGSQEDGPAKLPWSSCS